MISTVAKNIDKSRFAKIKKKMFDEIVKSKYFFSTF